MKLQRTIVAVGTVVVGLALADPMASSLPRADHGSGTPSAPEPPWPEGDEAGMGNTQGHATRLRCVEEIADPRSQVYELSHVRSNTMPASPFGQPETYDYDPTAGIPGSNHAGNGEVVSGSITGQGTQMDGLGHFGELPQLWDATTPLPTDDVTYYGGLTQQEVKPDADAPLARLGIENAPPIVTSAVLLDAQRYLNEGEPLAAGAIITAAHIEQMLRSQGLAGRGLLAGDVVLIRTGWGERWDDPELSAAYYTAGPGLAVDAAVYLGRHAVVLVALDNPFTDAVTEGQLAGEAPPPADRPDGYPFAVHHTHLLEYGVYQIQNADLAALADDSVWLSCGIVLPLRIDGGSGSPVRPIAIGAPLDDDPPGTDG